MHKEIKDVGSGGFGPLCSVVLSHVSEFCSDTIFDELGESLFFTGSDAERPACKAPNDNISWDDNIDADALFKVARVTVVHLSVLVFAWLLAHVTALPLFRIVAVIMARFAAIISSITLLRHALSHRALLPIRD